MRPMLLLLALSACSDPYTTKTLTDEGSVCVDGTDVTVDFGACLSSSCDTLVSSSCTASLEGSVVTVHAEAVIESHGTECTADCGFVITHCDLPDLTGVTDPTITYTSDPVAIDLATCSATP
jgi:hypothetical protein